MGESPHHGRRVFPGRSTHRVPGHEAHPIIDRQVGHDEEEGQGNVHVIEPASEVEFNIIQVCRVRVRWGVRGGLGRGMPGFPRGFPRGVLDLGVGLLPSDDKVGTLVRGEGLREVGVGGVCRAGARCLGAAAPVVVCVPHVVRGLVRQFGLVDSLVTNCREKCTVLTPCSCGTALRKDILRA